MRFEGLLGCPVEKMETLVWERKTEDAVLAPFEKGNYC